MSGRFAAIVFGFLVVLIGSVSLSLSKLYVPERAENTAGRRTLDSYDPPPTSRSGVLVPVVGKESE